MHILRSLIGAAKRSSFPALREWWTVHRTRALCIAVVLTVLAALLEMGKGFFRLLLDQSFTGAIDLRLRHSEVHGWFAGRPVYEKISSAVYPPASYAILWPLLGWLELTPARWLWAGTSVLTLGALAYLIVRDSGADARLERIFLALLPFAMYATSVTIGNGQLVVHLLPALVAGYTLLSCKERGWSKNLVAEALILFTLVSPTIAPPFFWIALFVPDTLYPALRVLLGYLALSLFAVWFQGTTPVSLGRGWGRSAVAGAAIGAEEGGYANLHSWLGTLDQEQWNLPASLFVLAALGVWTYRHRHVDLWLLLGTTAIVARFWAYHRLYNDLLILLPMVTLFRIAKRSLSTEGSGVVAGVLLAVSWVAMLSPPRLLDAPPPWGWLLRTGQGVIWVAMLLFLLIQAWRERARWSTNETLVPLH